MVYGNRMRCESWISDDGGVDMSEMQHMLISLSHLLYVSLPVTIAVLPQTPLNTLLAPHHTSRTSYAGSPTIGTHNPRISSTQNYEASKQDSYYRTSEPHAKPVNRATVPAPIRLPSTRTRTRTSLRLRLKSARLQLSNLRAKNLNV